MNWISTIFLFSSMFLFPLMFSCVSVCVLSSKVLGRLNWMECLCLCSPERVMRVRPCTVGTLYVLYRTPRLLTYLLTFHGTVSHTSSHCFYYFSSPTNCVVLYTGKFWSRFFTSQLKSSDRYFRNFSSQSCTLICPTIQRNFTLVVYQCRVSLFCFNDGQRFYK